MNHDSIKFLSLNAQSIMNKKESLWELLDHQNPDICCVCETWLNSDILNNEILPTSYKLFRKDRADGYGGILIGVKCNIPSDLIDVTLETEVCTVLLQLSNHSKLIVICAYRPPYPDVRIIPNKIM